MPWLGPVRVALCIVHAHGKSGHVPERCRRLRAIGQQLPHQLAKRRAVLLQQRGGARQLGGQQCLGLGVGGLNVGVEVVVGVADHVGAAQAGAKAEVA